MIQIAALLHTVSMLVPLSYNFAASFVLTHEAARAYLYDFSSMLMHDIIRYCHRSWHVGSPIHKCFCKRIYIYIYILYTPVYKNTFVAALFMYIHVHPFRLAHVPNWWTCRDHFLNGKCVYLYVLCACYIYIMSEYTKQSECLRLLFDNFQKILV